MARCGSTAVANMMASAKNVVVLAEAAPVFDVLKDALFEVDSVGPKSIGRALLIRLLAHLYVSGATVQAASYFIQKQLAPGSSGLQVPSLNAKGFYQVTYPF